MPLRTKIECPRCEAEPVKAKADDKALARTQQKRLKRTAVSANSRRASRLGKARA